MKSWIPLIISLVLIGCNNNRPDQEYTKDISISITELGYGVMGSDLKYMESYEASPSNHQLVVGKDVHILRKEDNIKLEKGLVFGSSFQVNTDVNDTIPLLFKWTFPLGMKNTNGDPIDTTAIFYSHPTNIPQFGLYTIEDDNEMVAGEWQLEIKFKGVTHYKKSFHLY